MSSDVSKKKIIMVNEVKQNNAPETIITPPVLWLLHKELEKNGTIFRCSNAYACLGGD
jgi:hypothetical protein